MRRNPTWDSFLQISFSISFFKNLFFFGNVGWGGILLETLSLLPRVPLSSIRHLGICHNLNLTSKYAKFENVTTALAEEIGKYCNKQKDWNFGFHFNSSLLWQSSINTNAHKLSPTRWAKSIQCSTRASFVVKIKNETRTLLSRNYIPKHSGMI